MSEITKGSILQSNAENERNEIEKAIKHFINVRDKNFAVLDRFTKYIENGKVNGSNIVYKNRDIYLNLAIQALKEKLERENPKPLTIEELKQYKGKAIYTIEYGSEIKKCEILCDINDEYIRLCSEDEGLYDCSIGTYTRTWLAYAYEPKEVE